MNKSKFTCILLASALFAGAQLSHAEILTLQDTYKLALENDPQWAAIQNQYLSNQQIVDQRRARLLPQVALDGSYTEADTDSDYSTNIGTQSQSSGGSSTQYGISATQTLFNLTTWHNYKSGKALNNQNEAEFELSQDALIVRVVTSYLALLRANANIEYLKAEQEAISRQLEQSKQRFEVGLVAITDVQEAQAAYDTAVSARIAAESDQFVAQRELETITGVKVDGVVDLDKNLPIIPPEPMDLNAWIQQAMDNNPSLQAAIFAAESAQQDYKAARGAHAPTAQLFGGYAHTTNEPDEAIEFRGGAFEATKEETKGSTIGVSVNLPLYSGGSISSTRRRAHYSFLAAKDTENLRRREVIQDTSTFYQLMLTSVAQVKARKQSTKSAEVALEATEAGYEAGTRTIVDVLNVQRNLFQNQRDYINARFDYVLNALGLKQSTGMLSPKDVQALNKWMAGTAQTNSTSEPN